MCNIDASQIVTKIIAERKVALANALDYHDDNGNNHVFCLHSSNCAKWPLRDIYDRQYLYLPLGTSE